MGDGFAAISRLKSHGQFAWPWHKKISCPVLIAKGILSEDQLRIALIEQLKSNQPVGKLLVSLGFVTEATLRDALSESLGKQSIDLSSAIIDPSALALVPLAVGHATPEAVAEVLDLLWGGAETLIVVSSDLSHFLPYATAQQVDGNTCRHILQLDTHIHPEQACGAYPVNGLLLAAGRRGLKPTLLGLCNSGDTAGDRSRVVGYAAFAFAEGDDHG